MAVNGQHAEATAVGRVVAVNDKGIRFEGAEDWSNISKYAVGIVLPKKGDTVCVTFDRQGWIRSIEQVGADGVPAPHSSAPAPQTPPQTTAKDRTITRLAVLKAAAEFGAARPSLKSGDVLTIAASWERWVLREPSCAADDDLTDVF